MKTLTRGLTPVLPPPGVQGHYVSCLLLSALLPLVYLQGLHQIHGQ